VSRATLQGVIAQTAFKTVIATQRIVAASANELVIAKTAA